MTENKISKLNIELKLIIDALQAEGLEPYWQNSGGGVQVLCVEAPATPDGVAGEWLVAGEDDWACDEKIDLSPRLSYVDQNFWNENDNVWQRAYMIELPETLTEPHHLKHYAQLVGEFMRGTVSESPFKTWVNVDPDIENDSSEKKCVICKTLYVGHGNNAEPVMSGQCCDSCNSEYVIAARLQDVDSGQK